MAMVIGPELPPTTKRMDISIIIPCYNAASYLAQALGSALDQSRPPHEIIVVDDGSTDNSLDVARRFERYYGERVRVVAQRSGRASRTRNIGAMVATGDALMFLDADDVLAPDALEALVRALCRQPEGFAVCPWYRLHYVDERWVRRPPSCASRRPGQDALTAWLTGWYHPPCSVLWSRTAFEGAGRWDEIATVNDDGDIAMRALVGGSPLVQTTSGSAYYRKLPEGETSLSGTRLTEANVADRLRVMEKIAWRLEERGHLHRYRAPISETFRLIAGDADGRYPDLCGRARTNAQRYAPCAWDRAKAGARRFFTRSGQLYGGLRRRLHEPTVPARRAPAEPASVKHLEEIRYGLDRAGAVMHSETDGVASPRTVRLDRPVVSVIIPTYNRAHLLRRTLDSVRAQTFADFEVLVVDDGSTDDTEAVVTGYDDARVRYLRQPENRGVSAARNRGLREVRGEFIAFLDSDDEWLPDKLARQVARFRELPEEVGLVYTGVESVFGDGSRQVDLPKWRGDVYRMMLLKNVIHGGGSNVMLRRNVVASVGFFDEALPAIEDYDYWLRVTRFFRIDFVEEALIRYHEPLNVTRKSLALDDNLSARAQFYDKYRREMRRAGVAHLFLIKSGWRHLRSSALDVRGARRLVWRAARQKPLAPEAYPLLVRTLVPRPLYRLVRSRRHTMQL